MKNILKSLLKSDWIITLTSTILGLFIGLYLSNYNDNLNLEKGKESAYKQVMNEMDNNFVKLTDYNNAIETAYNDFMYLSSYYNDEMDIVIHKDSLNSINQKLDGTLVVNEYESDLIHQDSIVVSFNYSISSNLIVMDLHTVAWVTYKQTDYMSLTAFSCITSIQDHYNHFESFNIQNKEWRNNKITFNYMKDKESYNEFLRQIERLLMSLNLLEQIKGSLKNIKNCS